MIRRSTNPFTPTFGSMPYALAGRTELIDDVIGGLANRPGDPNRSTIFIGPRGSGKTVLLRTIAEEASAQGWVCVSVSARKGLHRELFDGIAQVAHHLLVSKPSTTITGVQVGPLGLQRELLLDEQQSDRFRLQAIVEDLNAQDIGLLVTIDELDPTCEELIDFIDTYQHLVTEGRDVALLMAGLPSKVSTLLLDESVSFIRRAFQRRLDPINRYEVEEALFATITGNDKQIDQEALSFAAEATQGFAFAIQLVGYYLWRFGYGHDVITVDDAHAMIAAEPVKKDSPPEKPSAPAVETAPLPEAAGASPQVSPTESVEENAFKPLPLAAAAPVAEETVPAAPAAPVQTPSGNPELDELPDIGGFAPSAAKGGGEEVIRDSDFATGKEEEPVSIGIRPDAPAPVAQNAAVMAQAIQTLLAKEN